METLTQYRIVSVKGHEKSRGGRTKLLPQLLDGSQWPTRPVEASTVYVEGFGRFNPALSVYDNEVTDAEVTVLTGKGTVKLAEGEVAIVLKPGEALDSEETDEDEEWEWY